MPKTHFVRTTLFPFWKGEWAGRVLERNGESLCLEIEGCTYTVKAPSSAEDLGPGDSVVGPWLYLGEFPRVPVLSDDLMPGREMAEWILSRVKSLPFVFSEPIGEDYGWGFWATSGRDQFWVALSCVEDGEWGVAVVPERGCNPLGWFHKTDPLKHEELERAVLKPLREEPEILYLRAEPD